MSCISWIVMNVSEGVRGEMLGRYEYDKDDQNALATWFRTRRGLI